jgi:hypothetical protein
MLVPGGALLPDQGRRKLVQGYEFGGCEEGLRGAEEAPALLAGCADDQPRILQRLESMIPVRALQFEESAGGDRLEVGDQGQGFVGSSSNYEKFRTYVLLLLR